MLPPPPFFYKLERFQLHEEKKILTPQIIPKFCAILMKQVQARLFCVVCEYAEEVGLCERIRDPKRKLDVTSGVLCFDPGPLQAQLGCKRGIIKFQCEKIKCCTLLHNLMMLRT